MKAKNKIILLAATIFLMTGLLSYQLFFQNERPSAHEAPAVEVSAKTHYNQLPKSHMDMAMGEEMNQQLKTEVKYGLDKIIVTNGESVDWKDCRFEMNATIVQKGYVYNQNSITSHSAIEISLSAFARDGVAFNPVQRKANNLMIMCSDTSGKMGWSYSSNR